METNQDKKFICKFCNKKYPCGKSLGGHIRIHLNNSSSTAAAAAADITEGEDANIKSSGPTASAAATASAGSGQSGYVLRENPKKTKWFTIERNNNALLPDKLCKECGKGFQSLKALCGHMACHSKNSSYFEDHSGTSEKLKELLVEDSQSDTETSSTPSKRRRSERTRYKAIIGANSSSLSFANGGGSLSSASGMEEEQEEVAMCLMMLSRDSGFKGCFGSVADSSDNNSSILEIKKNHVKCLYNGNGVLGVKKAKKREVNSVIENDGSVDSGSGYFMNGPRTVESDVSIDGFTKIGELKKSQVEFSPRFEKDFEAESGKRLSRFRRVKTELGKILSEKDGYDRADNSSKRYKNGSYDAEFDHSNGQKQGKIFLLGGNRTSNGKAKVWNDSLNDSNENSIDTDYVPIPLTNSGRMIKSSSGKKPIKQKLAGSAEKNVKSKKGKMHECPFCCKVFRSGQALGGHKRSHFVGSGEDTTVVIKSPQEAPGIPVPALIDLNLPPSPMVEDANGFVPW